MNQRTKGVNKKAFLFFSTQKSTGGSWTKTFLLKFLLVFPHLFYVICRRRLTHFLSICRPIYSSNSRTGSTGKACPIRWTENRVVHQIARQVERHISLFFPDCVSACIDHVTYTERQMDEQTGEMIE